MLLRRLAKGAGAVLLGDDSKLPRWYGRWDYGFWKLTKKEKASKDNHAVYIERYDSRRHRVWLMDPLGRPGWKGEWISICGAASIRVDHRWRGPDRGRHPDRAGRAVRAGRGVEPGDLGDLDHRDRRLRDQGTPTLDLPGRGRPGDLQARR